MQIELGLNAWVMLIGWSFILIVCAGYWLTEKITGNKNLYIPEWLKSVMVLDLVVIFTFAIKQLLSCPQ